MNKNCFLAGALLLAAGAVQADPSTWRFQFSGLDGTIHLTGETVWQGEASLAGEIQGEDLNHDQLIDRSELSSLTIAEDGFSEGNFASCGTWGTITHYCTLDRFVFAPDAAGGPALDISATGTDEPSSFESRKMELVTGERYVIDEAIGATNSYYHYFWTDKTTLLVTPVSPVPEPPGGLMLAAGLLGFAAMRRAPGGRWPAGAGVADRLLRFRHTTRSRGLPNTRPCRRGYRPAVRPG